MVQVVGYLRDDATYGETKVLESLTQYLPKEWSVYVECPLHHDGLERMPDFIVVANFGLVVLEVKDWVNFKADRYEVTVRSRSGKVHKETSPVRQAKQFAVILAQMLESEDRLMRRDRGKLKIPWGYAVVFAHARSRQLQDLRRLWGDPHVMGLGDLQPRVITRRLKATLPFDYDLRREDLDAIREVVNPSVSIVVETSEDKVRQITLDETQESLVTEQPRVPRQEPEAELSVQPAADQLSLVTTTDESEPSPTVTKEEEALPPSEVQALTEDFSVRLVRGVAGSGKTVVLLQRARYLAAQHPQWRIGVLTYNKALQEILRANLKGISQIKVMTFDGLCSALLHDVRPWSTPANPEGWVNHHADQWPIVRELGSDFVSEEIKWIKDTGVITREAYLEIERKGRGQGLLRGGRQREALWEVLEAYDTWLADTGTCDWADLPHLVQQAIAEGAITPDGFDAVLVDEAQDFAPSWFSVIKQLVNPETGVLFLTDDPSQSIFRRFSWREKGVEVVGRTRWLRVPYRNTREIYEAAYEVIKDDPVLQQELTERDGALVPDLTSQHLRRGPRPELRQFRSTDDEATFIGSQVAWLMQTAGYDAREIAVLSRRRTGGVNRLKHALRGTGIRVESYRKLKGLEFEVVFLTALESFFGSGMESSEQRLSSERRVVYMAMTRARERLYLTCNGQWPKPLTPVLQFVDAVYH